MSVGETCFKNVLYINILAKKIIYLLYIVCCPIILIFRMLLNFVLQKIILIWIQFRNAWLLRSETFFIKIILSSFIYIILFYFIKIGNERMHILADLTEKNMRGGTPWSTVNNLPSSAFQNRVGENLSDLICSLYKVLKWKLFLSIILILIFPTK